MPLFRRVPLGVLLVAGLITASWAAANCSAGNEFQSGSAISSQGGSGGGGLIVDGSGASSPGDGLPDPDAACALITEQANATPLNLYIMLDRSSSMKGDNWDSAKAGLSAFVNDPDSAGIKIALSFFPTAMVPTCDYTEYKDFPTVAFGALPQNAMPIIQAMGAAAPTGMQSPVYPALNGAILAVKQQVQKNVEEAGAVLLVTDGQPQGPTDLCGGVDPQDPKVIADIAKAGTMVGVKTFVIGLNGVNQSFANQVALAGGTDAAILVGVTNVEAEFQVALAKVRGNALPCSYDVPSKVGDGEVEIGLVNVLLTPGGGKTKILPQNPACNGEGWQYDKPVMPERIVFCPSSCQALKADFSAKVQILLGCKTEVAK
jgi:hypothetical protein